MNCFMVSMLTLLGVLSWRYMFLCIFSISQSFVLLVSHSSIVVHHFTICTFPSNFISAATLSSSIISGWTILCLLTRSMIEIVLVCLFSLGRSTREAIEAAYKVKFLAREPPLVSNPVFNLKMLFVLVICLMSVFFCWKE